jgi:hypothetical protein
VLPWTVFNRRLSLKKELHCAIDMAVLKSVTIAGREVLLRSTDGKRWFSMPSDLLEYGRRRAREGIELRRALLERLRRHERSGEVKSLLDADCGGEIRFK